ncbi:phospholipid-transporting ATPase ABCA7 isoform X2 [Octopus bimaculoides]|uniref:phospholipid-transporting ATPase ABCA7 isoform X2 n=1 Tax=Octopus bimaculoides TaxID=37653 RepID=UPI00071CF7A7|nr:phospholipid-transporting ATPase ABCA7 isoform X2 [Octopus bimaculoides]|eukprot:XP_014791431.1 PREDICTED: ATP-binding cassette sub-family A member 7-like isoform X2 [Octopus bimaculoides]
MESFRHLTILTWKNLTLHKRNFFRAGVEIIWPLCLFLILVAVKTRPDLIKQKEECHFDGRALPSAGLLPFVQTYVCTISNNCHKNITTGELPGVIDNFNQSILTKVVKDVQIIIKNSSYQEMFLRSLETYRILEDLYHLLEDGNVQGSLQISNFLIDPGRIQRTVREQRINITPSALAELQNASINLMSFVKMISDREDIGTVKWMNDVQNILTQRAGILQNPNNVQMIYNSICNGSMLTRVLTFQDPSAAIQVQKELCQNLTQKQALMLAKDFQDNFSWIAFIEEFEKYAKQNTHQTLDLKGLVRNLVLVEDFWKSIQKMEYLGKVFTNWNDISDQIRNFNPQSFTNGSVNSTAILNSISNIFCGRNTTLEFSGYQQSKIAQRLQDYRSRPSVEKNLDDLDDTVSDFYKDVMKSLENNPLTRFLWKNVIKSVMLGVIPYAPDAPIVKKIIKKASEGFENIRNIFSELVEIANNPDNIIKNLRNLSKILTLLCSSDNQQINSSPFLQRDFIDSLSLCQSNVTKFFMMTKENKENISRYTWEKALNNTFYLVKILDQYSKYFNFDKFKPYPNESALVKDSLQFVENDTLLAALIFNIDPNSETLPTHVEYKIRMDADKVDSTQRIRDKWWTPGPRPRPLPDQKYFTHGFIFLQDMIDHAIIGQQTGQDVTSGIYTQQFPYPCYLEDKFTKTISKSLPLFMVLAWIFSVAMIVKSVVYEKEKRLKEVMKIMGLKNNVYWISWFIDAFVIMMLSVILLVITLKGGHVIEHSDAGLLFLFMLCFCISTISLCFLISMFFSRANLAAVCGGFIYYIIYLPYNMCMQWEDYMNIHWKRFACLSSNVAFGFGCHYIARFEEQAVGLQWSNINSSSMPDDKFSMLQCMFMMLLDASIYLLLSWYIEAVYPGTYGIPRKWYFPFQKSYWLGYSYKYTQNVSMRKTPNVELSQEVSEKIEKVPNTFKVGVELKDLKKVYKKGQQPAVDGLSLKFYEGQITSFLGHNGAGKTTTVSILTGLFPPTDGTAIIYGKDVRCDIDDIRKNLSVCPQFNVLFDLLTVEEHLWFYAKLRGRKSKYLSVEIDKMMHDVGLLHKRKEPSKNLSGGMKRKLSVAISFIGGSKTVILDEPTAGVDPSSRRDIWDILLKYRQDRTIILTTHHMDEADILGDRIAIISNGKLQCCGSSLFLKKQYIDGYYLTIVKAENKEDSDKKNEKVPSLDLSNSSSCPSFKSAVSRPLSSPESVNEFIPSVKSEEKIPADLSSFNEQDNSLKKESSLSDYAENLSTPGFSKDRLVAFIKKYVPNSELIEDIGTEICFQLINDEEANFEELFSSLELNYADLGISTYGISDTTLEEVFLKVTEGCFERENIEAYELENTDAGILPRSINRDSFRRRLKNKIFKLKDSEKPDDKVVLDQETKDEMEACQGEGSYKVTGWQLTCQQFIALLKKRFHYQRRSKKGFICEILLPAAFVLLAMILAMIIPTYSEEPPLILHPWHYVPVENDRHLYMFFSNDAPYNNITQNLEQMLLSRVGIGNRCMNKSIYSLDGYPCQYKTSYWTSSNLMPDTLINCSCETGVQVCPKDPAYPQPPAKLISETDIMYNMTGRNISDWIVKTTMEYVKKRYGGFSFGEVNSLKSLNKSEITSFIDRLSRNSSSNFAANDTIWKSVESLLEGLITKNVAKVWFNNKGWASVAIYVNIMNNIVLRSSLPPGAKLQNYGITTINHPMALTKKQLTEENVVASVIDVLIAIGVLFALSFVPASFTLFLIEERKTNAKHLQMVCGTNHKIYWLAAITWDLINYCIPALLCILIFLAFDQQAYVSSTNLPCLIALLFLYGWAIIPMMYPFARFFDIPSTAFVALSCTNVFLGTITTLATFILEMLQNDDEELRYVNDILKKVFLLLPQYCFGRGLVQMAQDQLIYEISERFGETVYLNPFEWNKIGQNLFALFILGIIFFTITLLLEYSFWKKFWKPKRISAPFIPEDTDVKQEREKVMSNKTTDDILIIKNLTKVYTGYRKKQLAVDRLCISVPKGQCFGLLGVNGAGKTTTFKMLTGEISPTFGDAYINGHSIKTNINQVYQSISYCPQFDALNSLLTGREHLELYARLRGVPEKEVKQVANWAIYKLDLTKYADRPSQTYSGGNKRKLSTAIALIGNPSIIFLDEPTSGMDPKARRYLWNCINSLVKSGRSIILTSHSMEECEALCGKIAIMVNGRFQCLGSVQHLKNRFGDGYLLAVRLHGQHPDLQPVMKYITEHFPHAVCKEKHYNMISYQLGIKEVSLSKIFCIMENMKSQMNIEEYSVTQTTLDQVFIHFANSQSSTIETEIDLHADLKFVAEKYGNSPQASSRLVGETIPLSNLAWYDACDS